MIDVTKLVYDNSYTIDKPVFISSGSYDVASQPTLGALKQYTIPHKMGRPLFVELLWAFGVAAAAGDYNDGGSSVDPDGNLAIAYSDSTNIYILSSNLFIPPAGTLYYKVIGSWIDGFDTTTPSITPVINSTGGQYFDSRNNYQKIAFQGVTTMTGMSGTVNVNHNLGYLPNAKFFMESLPGQVWPSLGGGVQDFWLYDVNQYECYGVITTSQLQLTWQGGVSSVSGRIWYRIYYDH